MRWNEIINESSDWNLSGSGFWITETGERIDVDRNKGMHHASIAIDKFLPNEDMDPDLDDILKSYDAAYEEGWIRVSISYKEVGISFWKLNGKSLNSLKVHLKNDEPDSVYTIEFKMDAYEFDSLKGLFRKLNEIARNKINESSDWDLSGFWITETGERINVDHDEDKHHANIALDYFIEYFDDVDEEDEEDEHIVELALETAFDEGWIRVSTSPREIDVTFWKLNRNSLNSLRSHLKDEQPVDRYVLDHVAEFGTLKELLRKMNEIFHKQEIVKEGA